ncbi:hypothetical protein D3C77_118680 [compost metagenome]
MAVNRALVPMASCRLAGVIWILLTVRLTAKMRVWPVTPWTVALTMASPRARALNLPLASTFSTVGLLLCQVAWVETSLVVSSDKVAMACSCSDSPLASLAVGGIMVTLVAMASVMVNSDLLLVIP